MGRDGLENFASHCKGIETREQMGRVQSCNG